MTGGARQAVEAALAVQALPRAIALAETAVAAGNGDPLLLHLVGWQHAEAGALDAALELLLRARLADPDDASLMTTTAQVLRRLGRTSEALALLDRAVALAPGDSVVWLERGFAFDAGGALLAAAENYAQALRLDPQSAAAHAGLAMLAARQAEGAAARDHGLRALAIDPANAVAVCAVARAEIDGGTPDAAATRLHALLAGIPLSPENHILALSLLGDAQGARGDSDAAFNAYSASKAAFSTHYESRRVGVDHRSFIERIDAEVSALGPVRLPGHKAAAPVAGHAFLLGYPRSGTTLVETILTSAPGVDAIEERPTLQVAAAEFLLPPGGIARLATIDAKEARRFQDAYWQAATGFGAKPGRVLIDMDPLKGLMLPIIGTLFPDARIVVMRRDPRDVVWSCFRCNFTLSTAALDFVSLERTARHYDALMRLTERSLSAIANPVHLLRYDDLVGDFDQATQDLCGFLGIDWSPALRDFGATARRGNIATASAAQVRRGLFNGSGQWRQHERHLAPILPILAPWVERFGFAS